jgi:hypothetical protein
LLVGALLSLVMSVMSIDSQPVRAQGNALLSCPTCARTGTCADPSCSEGGGRYIATELVVMDNAHGRRLWQRGFGPRGDFAAAEAYCASLVLHGIAGWRLPSNPEMGTIVLRPAGLGARPDACVPSADQAAFLFPDLDAGLDFWTSSAQPPQPIRYIRNFIDGRSPRTFEDDTSVHVRCVHDPLF